MCAQFMIKAELAILARRAKARFQESLQMSWDRVLPHGLAPVILFENGERVIKLMNFSLIPSWSKDRRVKFATHNARLMSIDERTGKEMPIYEKPTWKRPFLQQRCVVPMTGFVEPIYTGALAGNMVNFHPASSGADDVLFAAGIYDVWHSKVDGEVVESFAVLTDNPIPFVAQTGHDRSPVFIREDAIDAWIIGSGPGATDPARLLETLRAARGEFSIQAEIDRPLAKGWEKRVKAAQ